MRLNRKCRRTLRDERAGLSFHWRLAGSSWMRLLTAVLLAALLFGGASSLFELRGKNVRQVRTNPVSLRILSVEDEGSRALLEWARQHSPFPDRWEPDVDGALHSQIAILDDTLAERAQYRPNLRPLPELERQSALPELFDLTRPRLPGVKREMERVVPPPAREVIASSEAGGALRRRWQSEPIPLRELMGDPPADGKPFRPAEKLGMERIFLVRMDSAGSVLFCQSLEHLESELDAPFSRWLRQHRGMPDPRGKGMVWGRIRVSVRRAGAGAGADAGKAKEGQL